MIKEDAYQLAESFGYLTRAEVSAIKEAVVYLPPDSHVVNIGAGSGTSGLAILETREDLRLTTVDIRLKANPYGGLENEIIALEKSGIKYKHRHRQIHGDSRDVGRHWANGKLDMIFIDGDHSLEGASGDIAIWIKHVKKGGLILVDDYLSEKGPNKDVWPGVTVAVDTLLYPFYEIIVKADSVIGFIINE